MKRGEILIVDYPFTDASGHKRRPVLVVQSDAVKSPDVVVAAISASAQLTATRVPIEPSKEPASHLTFPCVVRCENLLTLQHSTAYGSIGRLSASTMKRVDECLRIALGL